MKTHFNPPYRQKRVLLSCLALVASTSTITGQNLIKNGDFGQGTDHWSLVQVEGFDSYPRIVVIDSAWCPIGYPFRDHLFIDVPSYLGQKADAYAQQTVRVPQGGAELSMLVFGALDPVTAIVSIIDEDENEHVLDSFSPVSVESYNGPVPPTGKPCSGEEPETRTYNMTSFGGQLVKVRLRAKSIPGNGNGTIAYFDNVELVSTRLNSTANVAQDASVTLGGAPFFEGGQPDGYPVEPKTAVDGTFLPRGRAWNQGPVWWDSRDGQARYIDLNLGGTFLLEALVVQADDNDEFLMYYRDLRTETWTLLWEVPNFDHFGSGMQTRPNPADDTQLHLLPAPVTTNALRLVGKLENSDQLFAVAEIQAYGKPAGVILSSPADGSTGIESVTSLTWFAVAGADRYDVQVSSDADFNHIVHSENTPELETTFVAPVASHAYFWRVRAVINDEPGDWSTSRRFSVGESGSLSAELVSPEDGAINQTKAMVFSWMAAPAAASYHFQLSLQEDFSTSVSNVEDLATTNQSVSGMLGATTYYWRVAGVDDQRRKTFSKPRSFTTVVDAPGAITLVSPVDGATNIPRIETFSWDAMAGAQSYQLQVSTDDGFSNIVANDSALTETKRTNANPLDYGTTYFWRVRGRNAGGNGAWSEVRSFSIIVASPDAVALLEPENAAKGVEVSPTFSWTGTPSAILYQLQVATDSLMSGIIVNDSALVHSVDSLTAPLAYETTYFWRVRARNAGGDGQWSDVWSFRTAVAAPGAVALGAPEDGATGVPPFANLTWQTIDDVIGYHLQLSADAALATPIVDDSTLTDPSWMAVDPLAYSTTFFWHVRAVRDDGLGKTTSVIYGPWSATRSFTVAVGTASESQSGIPTEFALHPPYPNPFNPSTTISYDLPEAAFVNVTVFDALGRFVESLVNGHRPAGKHSVMWDAFRAPSGMYFVRMEAGAFSRSQRVLLLK